MKNNILETYESFVDENCVYPGRGNNVYYPAIGISEEAGEIMGEIKKLMRDNDCVLSDDIKLRIKKEMGDLLFYIVSMCKEVDSDIEEIMNINMEKIKYRLENNLIHGRGSDR